MTKAMAMMTRMEMETRCARREAGLMKRTKWRLQKIYYAHRLEAIDLAEHRELYGEGGIEPHRASELGDRAHDLRPGLGRELQLLRPGDQQRGPHLDLGRPDRLPGAVSGVQEAGG